MGSIIVPTLENRSLSHRKVTYLAKVTVPVSGRAGTTLARFLHGCKLFRSDCFYDLVWNGKILIYLKVWSILIKGRKNEMAILSDK